MYIFYSNVETADQWYGIHPGTLIELLGDVVTEQIDLLTSITATILNADQLYSTAGKAPIFNINAGYNTCTGSDGAENRFELSTLTSDSPNVTCPGSFSTASPGGVCVELPAMSMGYIVIPIDIIPLRVGNP